MMYLFFAQKKLSYIYVFFLRDILGKLWMFVCGTRARGGGLSPPFLGSEMGLGREEERRKVHFGCDIKTFMVGRR